MVNTKDNIYSMVNTKDNIYSMVYGSDIYRNLYGLWLIL